MISGLMPWLLFIPSAVCAVAPMVAFLAILWWLDRFDRGPLWLVFLTFAWGAVGGVLFGVAGSLSLEVPLWIFSVRPEHADAIGAAVIAPLAEEPAKALFLLLVMWNRNFDGMTHGFVYGAAAGLGFGMTENFLYFQSVAGASDLPSWLEVVVIRTFFSAVMHASATSMVGAALGFARFRGKIAIVVLGSFGLLLAMSMHALWNGLITLDVLNQQQGLETSIQAANYFLFPMEVFVLFVIFQVALLDEGRTIRRELEEEARAGLIPADHPKQLSSWFGRHFTSGWLSPKVPSRRYIQASTSLAIRKVQARATVSEFHRDEVARLRRRIRLLLERAGDAPQPQ